MALPAFTPTGACARRAIQCLIDLQARSGGDSLIGRRLYPILVAAGLRDVQVVPKLIYVDARSPELIEGFTRNTFTAMVEGVRERALELGLIDLETWDGGIADLHRTAEADGTFCYTFFKGVGTNRVSLPRKQGATINRWCLTCSRVSRPRKRPPC